MLVRKLSFTRDLFIAIETEDLWRIMKVASNKNTLFPL